MKQIFFPIFIGFVLIINLLLQHGCKQTDDSQFFLPGDFELVASTSFIWSAEHQEIIPRLAALISRKDKVTFYTDDQKDNTESVNSILKKYQADFSNINIIPVYNKPAHIWIRDFGPVFLINKKGETKIVRFDYFGIPSETILNIPGIDKYPGQTSSLISTGGSRESNGKGTIILVEAHEMDVNRGKTKSEIEKELSEKLGIRNFIWLKQGIPQDDNPLKGPLAGQIYPNGINGHVDEFCRFADSRTLLISQVTDREAHQHPILAEAKKRLDENYQILINARDQDGKKFRIIRVPFAPLHIVDRSTPARNIFVTPVTSYMNFIITRSWIILPSYLSQDTKELALKKKEEEVISIFKKVFPRKEIQMVPVGELNYFSGGFHCLSYNEPSGFR